MQRSGKMISRYEVEGSAVQVGDPGLAWRPKVDDVPHLVTVLR